MLVCPSRWFFRDAYSLYHIVVNRGIAYDWRTLKRLESLNKLGRVANMSKCARRLFPTDGRHCNHRVGETTHHRRKFTSLRRETRRRAKTRGWDRTVPLQHLAVSINHHLLRYFRDLTPPTFTQTHKVYPPMISQTVGSEHIRAAKRDDIADDFPHHVRTCRILQCALEEETRGQID